jgi:CelD/BcsL family acetyltransferase involved in cellulose biosynthesis
MRVEVIDDVAAVARYVEAWDALAVESGRPYCAPGWLLAWWRHAAPPRSTLAVVIVREGHDVVGVGPFWSRLAPLGRVYRTLGWRAASPVTPLARRGRESDVAAAVTRALGAGARPAPGLRLESAPAGSRWPALLVDGWPGSHSAVIVPRGSAIAPAVTLRHPDIDAWFATRSQNFRQQMRRARRAVEAAGGRFRLSRREDIDRDVDALVALHHARWQDRGGSAVLDARMEAVLRDAGRALVDSGRYRLWSIDIDGRSISTHLFLAAGGTQCYWLGGFDETWAAQRPALLALVAAVQHGIELGEERLDLGPGAEDYKYRFADTQERFDAVDVVPTGVRAALARGDVEARRVARPLKRRAIDELLPLLAKVRDGGRQERGARKRA